MPTIQASGKKIEIKPSMYVKTVQPTTQHKTITPKEEIQEILPDEGVFALSGVTVESIPDNYTQVEGTLNIDKNGEYDVRAYEKADINVDLDMSAYFDDAPQTVESLGTTKYAGYWIRLVKKLPPIKYLPKYCYELFADFKGESLDFSQISSDSKPETIGRMFYRLEIPKLDISPLDFSEVYTASYLFYYCNCKEYNIKSLSLPNVTSWDYMFAYSNIKNSDLPDIDYSYINTCAGMFSNCVNLTGDVVATNIYGHDFGSLCSGCKNIISLKMSSLEKLDNHLGKNISYLVNNCTSLKTLDLSEFGSFLSKIEGGSSNAGLYHFVRGCTALENLIFGEGYGTAFKTGLSANSNYSKIDLSTCTLLTKASVLDVFNKVADISAKNTQQIVLPPNMIEQLTEEELTIPTGKGWTVL